MRTPDGKVIYGNVLVGQRIKFDASRSNSIYPIDKFFWDFDGDGKYDKITSGPITYHIYTKPGTYNAKLLAKASTAPPAGDGDVVFHKIVVVEHFVKPVGLFEIKRGKNGTYYFNASKSYDPDGYIRSYSWDFDGDGKLDFSSFDSKAEWRYEGNGYYVVKLRVMDYDFQKNESIRVIKVDDMQGEIEEKKGRIEILNRCNGVIKINFTLNNRDAYEINLTQGKKYISYPLLNPVINEISISACGHTRVIVFNGTKIKLEINENGIHTLSNSTPAFQLIPLISAILLVILKKRNDKKRHSQ